MLDTVVVGGGPAGLAAASAFGDHEVTVLEAEDHLGGRMYSLARQRAWINLGAHLLTGGDSAIKQLGAVAGVDVLPVPGVKTAIWFGGKLHSHRRVEWYPFALPLSWRERWDLIRFGIQLRLGVERWRRAGCPRRGESEAARTARLHGYRDGRTFAHTMRGVAPRVAEIFRTAARRSAGEADRLTEGAAAALFGALWVSGSTSVVNVAGGSGRFGEAWQRRLGDRGITGAKVTSVVEHDDHVAVTYRDRDGNRSTLRAQQVIVAIPAPQVSEVVLGLPADVHEELSSLAYGPFVCVGVLTKPLPPMPWDDIYAIAVPGADFDMLFHHTNPVINGDHRNAGPRSLMCYAGGDKAAALLTCDEEEIRRLFLAQMSEVLPQIAGAVDEAVVRKWTQGNCYPVEGASVTRTQAWNHRPGGRVVLAGDYFAPLGGTLEAAARSGLASADILKVTAEHDNSDRHPLSISRTDPPHD